MATINDKKRTNDWNVGGIRRRDFRADHGSGPEEMPHRRKGRGKKVCKRSKDGKHDFSVIKYKSGWRDSIDPETGKRKYVPHQWPYRVCSHCTKPQGYVSPWGHVIIWK